MRLTPGTRLGAYEVIDGLGAGGMGEVYRARDTSLHREIALKLVHPDYCHHADSLARLQREARLLASLNHPNIATLHGLAEFDGSCGLVMELVAGDTLAATLRRRRLKIEECLSLASQIAAALEAAHDHGVVHRDLKPANIKITPDGNVKVLDFGLAKAVEDGRDQSASTLVTQTGTVVGTIPYMSPEHARGLDVDRRTDIWAFGCVLFEMLTGKPAFDGDSRSDIVVAILEKEPEWSWLPRDTPPLIRRLLNRCLQKDVRRRMRDIGDARLEIEEVLSTQRGSDVSTAPAAIDVQRGSWMRAAAFAAGGVLGAAATAAVLWQTGATPATEVRFSIVLPEDERLASTELGSLAMQSDGRSVVYASSRGSTTHLLIRNVNGGAARPLPGTFGAVSPFFSPDGEWVGFFADGKLKKVPVSGGTVSVICDAPDGLGASWSHSGTIVFASATGAPLQRVAANGGRVTRATELIVSNGEFSHRWPEFLPDGDTVLFTVGTVGEWSEAEIVAQSLTSGTRTSVIKGGSNPRYLASGYLAYAHDRAIWIVPFDARRLTVTGTPQRALEGVAISADGAAQFAVSSNAITYHIASPQSTRRLVIVDGQSETPLAAPPHAYVAPRVAPNGKTALLGISDTTEHLWSYDFAAGALTQLTFEAANRAAIWSADGQRVTFASNRNGPFNLFSVPPNAEGAVERLTTADALQLPGSWSPDGEWLAFMEQNPTTGRDVWLRRRNGERVAFAQGAADESAPRFSPDGRWIAYVSNETGQPEVYVRAANAPGPVRQITSVGGSEPVWRADSAAVFFRSYGKTYAVPLGGGNPRVVVDQLMEPGTFDAAGYDVIGNSDRFLMMSSAAATATSSELRIILNWSPGTTSSQ